MKKMTKRKWIIVGGLLLAGYIASVQTPSRGDNTQMLR